ncbi:MIP family Ig-specific serine endopeptidase [Mycoplasma parvum]|uniref:DUF31 domain-containing protein n=1 Tax=Mycoplasma parvum str. Indiana TaxID=1403316 RepID=U5NCV4_9MOLU|nr:hypothetical protein [Mycoplasma parvum]AGX89170.1 hypothetical protein PRV_02160 [Mycoplasma parvum str. Indiana]
MQINLTKIMIGGAAATLSCSGGVCALTLIPSISPFKQKLIREDSPPRQQHLSSFEQYHWKSRQQDGYRFKKEKLYGSTSHKKELHLYTKTSYSEELKKIYEADEKKKEFHMPHGFKDREWNNQKSIEIEQKIRDYTVGLNHKCGSGTGWILDYEWPENGKYPTKWFIATNAHVFERFDFSSSTYKQAHPRSCTGRWNTGSFFQLGVWKEVLSTNNRKTINRVGVKSTKLFYAARNHLEDALNNVKGNYFHDFIVLEVEFHDQHDAREATDNFHEKYGVKKEKPINFFHEGITKNEENFFKEETYTTPYYVGGFPIDEETQMTFNHNLDKYKGLPASTLSQETHNYAPKRLNHGKNAFRGLGDHSSFELQWGTGSADKQNLTGFIYWINQMDIGAGGSGSMVVDENGNLLGLYSYGTGKEREQGGVQPIRSYSLEMSENEKSPKFDLIRGTQGQKSSYKSQLDEYYKDKQTFLKNNFSEFNASF